MQAFSERTLQEMNARDVALWNEGRFDAFCQSYAEDAVFINGNTIICGRTNILAHYRKAYGDGGQQGTLSLAIEQCGCAESPNAKTVGWAMVRWTLTKGDRASTGLSTLTFKHAADGDLVIAQDLSWSL